MTSDPVPGFTPEQIAKVRAAVAKWPPLTPEQKEKLRALFDSDAGQPARHRRCDW